MTSPQIVDIETEKLQANPLQPRGIISPESLTDLIESIKEHGILEPLVVAKTPAGLQIIAGERRWRAAKIIGLKTVPVIIKQTTPQGMLEMALVENVQREDLNAIERAQAFIRLIDEFHLANNVIAKRIGKSPAYVSNTIKLLTLPDALKDGLLSGLITEGHARALSAIKDTKAMVDAYKMVLREGAAVRQAEEIARRMKKKIGHRSPDKIQDGQTSPIIISDETDDIKDNLHQALGGDDCTVVILTRSRVRTILKIILKGHLPETEEKLKKIYRGITGEDPSEAEASNGTKLFR